MYIPRCTVEVHAMYIAAHIHVYMYCDAHCAHMHLHMTDIMQAHIRMNACTHEWTQTCIGNSLTECWKTLIKLTTYITYRQVTYLSSWQKFLLDCYADVMAGRQHRVQ